MSRTARWYVVGPEGGRMVILGWSRTADAAQARAAKKPRRRVVLAYDRPQARRQALRDFGITVSYLKRNPETKRWEWTND